MVRFTVLASGSKGNCSVLTGGQTRILLDCGLSCRETFRRMREAGEEPESLNAILITHEHADHVNGIAVTARKLGIPVYFTQGTHRAWKDWIAPKPRLSRAEWLEQYRRRAALRESGEDDPAEEPEAAPQKDAAALPAVEYFQPGQNFRIGDLDVHPFTIPHDAADPCGFVFEAEGVRLGYATDLGYISPNVKAQLKNLDLLMLESNHDLEMLRDGPYPWAVKQRVLSRVGHLSNDATAEFLKAEYDGRAAHVILAHLSENNNLPELAKLAAERALAHHPNLLANRLLLAEQAQPLSPIYF